MVSIDLDQLPSVGVTIGSVGIFCRRIGNKRIHTLLRKLFANSRRTKLATALGESCHFELFLIPYS